MGRLNQALHKEGNRKGMNSPGGKADMLFDAIAKTSCLGGM